MTINQYIQHTHMYTSSLSLSLHVSSVGLVLTWAAWIRAVLSSRRLRYAMLLTEHTLTIYTTHLATGGGREVLQWWGVREVGEEWWLRRGDERYGVDKERGGGGKIMCWLWRRGGEREEPWEGGDEERREDEKRRGSSRERGEDGGGGRKVEKEKKGGGEEGISHFVCSFSNPFIHSFIYSVFNFIISCVRRSFI